MHVLYHEPKWIEDITYGFSLTFYVHKNSFLIVVWFEKTILLLVFSDQCRSIVLGRTAS